MYAREGAGCARIAATLSSWRIHTGVLWAKAAAVFDPKIRCVSSVDFVFETGNDMPVRAILKAHWSPF